MVGNRLKGVFILNENHPLYKKPKNKKEALLN
jgi:hypothetical protein